MKLEEVKKITMTQFKKDVLFKGCFKQYIITPYASRECNNWTSVVVLSDQVDTITSVHIRNRKKPTAIILPYNKNEDVHSVFNQHSKLLVSITGVDAPYFGVFNLPKKSSYFIDDKLIYKIRVA